jgi:hypothetical protein
MNLSEQQIKELFFNYGLTEAIATIIGNDGRIDGNTLKNLGLFDYIYEPDDSLITRLRDYARWRKTKKKTSAENAGKIMEEIAFLAFRCLKGCNPPKSYQSYAAQHDLVISGSETPWLFLMILLHIPISGRTMVVEAKNLRARVTDAQFSRLCFIVQNKFPNLCHLGVFLTRAGATGFPKRGSRLRSLKDSRATQALFHATTGKYVVVLEEDDILQLGQIGSLPRILEVKIREIEEASGLTLAFDGDWIEQPNLPPHLMKYIENEQPEKQAK